MTDPTDERLWGVPGAEIMHFDPVEAYGAQIDGDDPPGPYTLEEWTVGDPGACVPDASWLVEWVAEQATDEFTDDGATYERINDSKDLRAAAQDFLDAVASFIRISGWRQADTLVAEHEVTIEVHDNGSATARMDGQVLVEHPPAGGVGLP